MDAMDERALRKTAVGAAHHPVGADEPAIRTMRSATSSGCSTTFVWCVTTPGTSTLPSGSSTSSQQPPLVLVPGVRLLDQVEAGAHVEHEIDHVGERRVVRVWPVPASEAHVIADALLRDARERVVERLDAQRRPAPVVVDRAADCEDRVVLVQEHRVVDLEQEAGVDDRPVLLVQRIRDREDELLFGRVVLVAQPVDARGRDDWQESVGDVDGCERALEAREVARERRAVVGDRAGAEPALRSTCVACSRRARGSRPRA